MTLPAPVLRGVNYAATNLSGGSSSVTVSAAAGVKLGDMILIWCVMGSTDGTDETSTVSLPGFTATALATGGVTEIGTQLLCKNAVSSDVRASSYTITLSAVQTCAAGLCAYGNPYGGSVLIDGPIATPVTASTGTAVTANSVTTDYANETVVWLGGDVSNVDSGAPYTITVPAGFTARGAFTSDTPLSGGKRHAGVIIADYPQASPGTITSPAGSTVTAASRNAALAIPLYCAGGNAGTGFLGLL